MLKLRFLLFVILLSACQNSRKPTINNNSFHFELETMLSGKPEAIYDKLTGDISPWWDHTFSKDPLKLYIEAKPGGGFYEIFDDSGDGVRHAVVTSAHRGQLLRMEGPLGLAGHAINLVSTYHLSPINDSTLLKLEVHGSGEFKEDWPEVIEKVWIHFIIEQFKPYWHKLNQNQ